MPFSFEPKLCFSWSSLEARGWTLGVSLGLHMALVPGSCGTPAGPTDHDSGSFSPELFLEGETNPTPRKNDLLPHRLASSSFFSWHRSWSKTMFAHYLMERESTLEDPHFELRLEGWVIPLIRWLPGLNSQHPCHLLGDGNFPLYILLKASRGGHSSFLGPLHLQFNLLSTRTSRPEDPQILLMPEILYLLQLYLNANLQGPLFPLTALYFHSWFFLSIAIYPSPKPFPSICRILASLEIKSSKTSQTVHNLLSFPLPSLNILKPALHIVPLPPWRHQVGSLPPFVAPTLWFLFSTILPAHSSAHSPT